MAAAYFSQSILHCSKKYFNYIVAESDVWMSITWLVHTLDKYTVETLPRGPFQFRCSREHFTRFGVRRGWLALYTVAAIERPLRKFPNISVDLVK